MSREVRRVPLGWQHPTTHNPYWREQQARRFWRGDPEPQLHAPEVRFVGLCDDYPDAVRRWEEERNEVAIRAGHRWTFGVEYHLTGYQGREDASLVVHPWYSYADDGETGIETTVRDEDHLHELLTAEVEQERPDPSDYMPAWPEAEATGWVLYETVSEGTPVTPVFATADELIDHLATVGQDWGQKPMRRAAAETLVRQGFSFGSMVSVGGKLYDSAEDADLIAKVGTS